MPIEIAQFVVDLPHGLAHGHLGLAKRLLDDRVVGAGQLPDLLPDRGDGRGRRHLREGGSGPQADARDEGQTKKCA